MRDTHRLHVVCWRDAHGNQNENNREEVLKAHKPLIYWSAGILVQSDTVGVTIAQDLSKDDEPTYRTRTFIPRELVDAEFDAGILMRKRRKPKVHTTPLPEEQ